MYSTAIIKNPVGTFSVVGSVPITALDVHPMTQSDAMGGRVINVDGKNMGWTGKAFPTVEGAIEAIELGGVTRYQLPNGEFNVTA